MPSIESCAKLEAIKAATTELIVATANDATIQTHMHAHSLRPLAPRDIWISRRKLTAGHFSARLGSDGETQHFRFIKFAFETLRMAINNVRGLFSVAGDRVFVRLVLGDCRVADARRRTSNDPVEAPGSGIPTRRDAPSTRRSNVRWRTSNDAIIIDINRLVFGERRTATCRRLSPNNGETELVRISNLLETRPDVSTALANSSRTDTLTLHTARTGK